jgi:uncharacterized protein (TIGR02246 family)
MSEDERAIRDLVAAWMEASRAGDTDAVLALMADDMVFMVPGREPFGKEAFAAMSRGMTDVAWRGRPTSASCASSATGPSSATPST